MINSSGNTLGIVVESKSNIDTRGRSDRRDGSNTVGKSSGG